MPDERLATLLQHLDETPATTAQLARGLARPEPDVEALLREAEARGLATDWGDVWATTWRAKIFYTDPHFFRLWVPASVATGAAITLLAVALHGPGAARWMLPVLGVISAAGGGWSLWEALRDH